MRLLWPLLAIPTVAAQNETGEPSGIPMSLIISIVAAAALVWLFVYMARR